MFLFATMSVSYAEAMPVLEEIASIAGRRHCKCSENQGILTCSVVTSKLGGTVHGKKRHIDTELISWLNVTAETVEKKQVSANYQEF